MQFTAIPGPAKITNKGITVTLIAGEDISTDDYRVYVDVPCRISIEPLPTPVDGDVVADDGALDFEVE